MRLYSGKVKVISLELTRELIKQELIEVETAEEGEVSLDVESILREYMRTEREISEDARTLLEKRGLDYAAFGRTKRDIAKKREFGLGEDSVTWIIDQLTAMLLHTTHVAEVWGEDHDLRRAMAPVLRKHMDVDAELDQEVRNRIKNLNEGSTAWDIKYEQAMQDMKRRKGLE